MEMLGNNLYHCNSIRLYNMDMIVVVVNVLLTTY